MNLGLLLLCVAVGERGGGEDIVGAIVDCHDVA